MLGASTGEVGPLPLQHRENFRSETQSAHNFSGMHARLAGTGRGSRINHKLLWGKHVSCVAKPQATVFTTGGMQVNSKFFTQNFGAQNLKTPYHPIINSRPGSTSTAV